MTQTHIRNMQERAYEAEDFRNAALWSENMPAEKISSEANDMLVELQKELHETRRELVSKNLRIQKLERLATTDELTGLSNRRGFMDACRREDSRQKRGLGKSGILALIDLDNFKAVNDTYGHGCGDACLKLVAHTLQSISRNTDTTARLGGDEFVLLMPDTDKNSIAQRAQNITVMLNNLSVIWKGEEINIKASVGLKTFTETHSLNEIMDCADKDMYFKKQERKSQSKPH